MKTKKYIPIDEKSTEVLFASLEDITRQQYLGCCIDKKGKRMSSPDALYKNKETGKVRSFEFKYKISSIKGFQNNGKFDVVVAYEWGVQDQKKREYIIQELKKKHGTKEVIIIKDLPQVELHDYNEKVFLEKKEDSDEFMQRLELMLSRTRHLATIYGAFILATYNKHSFKRSELDAFLLKEFPNLDKDMRKQGIQNLLQALYPQNIKKHIKPNPVLHKKLPDTRCQWNNDFDVKTSLNVIRKIYNERRNLIDSVRQRGPELNQGSRHKQLEKSDRFSL